MQCQKFSSQFIDSALFFPLPHSFSDDISQNVCRHISLAFPNAPHIATNWEGVTAFVRSLVFCCCYSHQNDFSKFYAKNVPCIRSSGIEMETFWHFSILWIFKNLTYFKYSKILFNNISILYWRNSDNFPTTFSSLPWTTPQYTKCHYRFYRHQIEFFLQLFLYPSMNFHQFNLSLILFFFIIINNNCERSAGKIWAIE